MQRIEEIKAKRDEEEEDGGGGLFSTMLTCMILMRVNDD